MFFGCFSAAGLSKRIVQKGTGDGGDSPQGVLDIILNTIRSLIPKKIRSIMQNVISSLTGNIFRNMTPNPALDMFPNMVFV